MVSARLFQRAFRRRSSAVAAVAIVATALALAESLRVVHQQAPRRAAGALAGSLTISSSELERTLTLMTGLRVEAGNRVEPLLNGDATYTRLLRDLSSATRTIAMQMYYADPGRVADTVASILCSRARGGVRTLLLLDAFGAGRMKGSWTRKLDRCGVEVAFLRNLQWYTLHSATDRSHVRAVIVDGRIGYTGGFGLADYWLGDGHHADEWRESNVRFEGPAVAALQAAFATAWSEATGELLVGAPFLPPIGPDTDERGGVRAGLLFTAPTVGSTAAERFFTIAISGARRRLYIANSYFVPSRMFRELLGEAAARGVDVRILTVSGNTDVVTPWLAGRSYYDELVAAGVRIYEFQPAMMHAKTMVVDGAWGSIGTMNFDSRSMAFNDESNLVVFDSSFAAGMDSTFLDDLRYAAPMTADVLSRRHWWQIVLEHGAALLTRIL